MVSDLELRTLPEYRKSITLMRASSHVSIYLFENHGSVSRSGYFIHKAEGELPEVKRALLYCKILEAFAPSTHCSYDHVLFAEFYYINRIIIAIQLEKIDHAKTMTKPSNLHFSTY